MKIKPIKKIQNLVENGYYAYKRSGWILDPRRVLSENSYKEIPVDRPIFLLGTQGWFDVCFPQSKTTLKTLFQSVEIAITGLAQMKCSMCLAQLCRQN